MTTGDVASAARDVLRLRSPLGVGSIRAALKARKVSVSLAELDEALAPPAFVQDSTGRWSAAVGLPVQPGSSHSGVDGQDAIRDEVNRLRREAEEARQLAASERARADAAQAELDAELTRQSEAEAAEEREREAEEDARWQAEYDAHTRRYMTGRTSGRIWRQTPSGTRCFEVAEPESEGESVLRTVLATLEGALVAFNCHVISGRQERELDALVVHPHGVVTIEQKDIQSEVGALKVPLNGPVTVDGVEVGHDQARNQARKAAQLLRSMASTDPDLDLPFITPYLAFHGRLLYSDGPKGDVQACVTGDLSDILAGHFAENRNEVTIDAATRLLGLLELPIVPRGDLRLMGFPDRSHK